MERLDLPQLGLTQIKAKMDTGARTTALHAENIQTFERDGTEWVRFQVQAHENAPANTVEAPVHERRRIRNTGGIPEERIVVLTELKLTDRIWKVPVSLTDRSSMRVPVIVGRTTLRNHNVAVHTRRTYLTTEIKGRDPGGG